LTKFALIFSTNVSESLFISRKIQRNIIIGLGKPPWKLASFFYTHMLKQNHFNGKMLIYTQYKISWKLCCSIWTDR